MIKRLLTLILAGMLTATTMVALAEDPPKGDEPPVRLKKKGKPNAEDKPKVDPGKPDDKKPRDKDKEEPKAAPAPEPQVDEQEVLNRVAKTMRSVQTKLAKFDLGEGTRQAQEDILKDLDKLIRNSENPPPDDQNQGGGGGGGSDNNDKNNQGGGGGSGGSDNKGGGSDNKGGGSDNKGGGSDNKGGGADNKGGGSQNKPQGGGSQSKGDGKKQPGAGGGKEGGQQQTGRQERRMKRMAKQGGGGLGRPSGGNQQAKGNPGGGQPKDGNDKNQGNQGGKGGSGNQPGAGKDSPTGPSFAAERYKDVWGHLPESLRAEMNAYSNPEPFLAKYDELIRKYYRTIAEQGRKKGD